MRRGRGITYSRTERDLFTVRFKIAPNRLSLLGEAGRLIPFDPLGLLDPEKTIQWYREVEARYPELIEACSIKAAWNGRHVSLFPADLDRGAQEFAELLVNAKGSSLFPLGHRMHQLLLERQDFAIEAASLFPGIPDQGLTAQNTGSCVGCGLGVFGHFAGGYLAGLACLSGIGCALSVAVFIADTIGAAISCGQCAGGDGDNGSSGDPPPPPPPDCSPLCTP